MIDQYHESSFTPSRRKDIAIDQILGVQEETKQKFIAHFKKQFKAQDRLSYEGEKSSLELEIINEVLHYLPGFLGGYGITHRSFTEQNIHTFDENQLPENERDQRAPENIPAEYFNVAQGARIPSLKRVLEFAHHVAHELLHGTSYVAITGDLKEKNFTFSAQRGGLQTMGLDPEGNPFAYFHKLNEAIIEELTIRFDRGFFSRIPALAAAVKERDQFMQVYPLDPRVSGEIARAQQLGPQTWSVEGFPYVTERFELYPLIHDLFAKNRSTFSSPEEVFQVFVRATFTGKNLELADLVESTYGNGAFYKLGAKTGKKLPR